MEEKKVGELLPLDYPVNWDYAYVVELTTGSKKMVLSPIRGTVKDLLDDLRGEGILAKNIYSYKIFA
jgi:hypothetical protein